MASKIKQYAFKPGLPLEIEIISIGDTFLKGLAETTKPHRTDFYQVFWFQKGNPIHIVDFRSVELKPNSLLFIKKQRVHQFDPAGGYEGLGLLFTDQFFNRTDLDTKFLTNTILFNDLLDIPVIDLNESSPELPRIFSQIDTELNLPADALHYDILQNFLHNFLLVAERERQKRDFTQIPKGADLDYTFQFTQLIEKHFITHLAVNEYATNLSISERRLHQATTRILGKSPKELIDERILLEAKRLLVHTHLSIKEIGFQLGFEEPTYFNRYFRKHTGKTPIEFKGSYIGR
ncbi:AraC family transcriptional regulator [Xanthocytophaga flava]|uniref:AraC family transcriptional regulator n=1 Tax=Xanthocytophaga flava TaxID=3048013 RepID=UPI0028D42E34|nr:helix-turn-helix domain-containing protein [Xanthocytophaga flavus]MDJ1466557.1 helix-turn-helix domain-containing protein [Xanthocytophaga flavus]